MLRLYRKPLIVLLLASVTTAVGVSASQGGETTVVETAMAMSR
jgi:hypothetical protein